MTSIKFKVTREDSQSASVQLAENAMSTTGDYLSPYSFAPRNSLSSVSGKFSTTKNVHLP